MKYNELVEFEELNTEKKNDDIMVTIWCVTYNHAPYIEDTFKGFINQKTNFRYEVVVFDDASTDGTSDIVRKYAREYPELICAYIAKTNTYGNENSRNLIESLNEQAFHGKYIAWCEGDDFWSDPYKLQLQIDYLNDHPECSLCGHASKWIDYEKNMEYSYHPFDRDKDLTDAEVILQPTGNISTASLVMRRESGLYENDFPRADVGDIVAQLHALTKGKIHYIDREMSVYRYHHAGSWGARQASNLSNRINHAVNICRFLIEYDIYTHEKYHDLIKRKWCGYWYSLALDYKEVGWDEYHGICQDVTIKSQNEYDKINIGRLELLRNTVLYKQGQLGQEDIEKISSKRSVLIFGTGDYSKYAEILLENSGLDWNGYIVSNSKKGINNKDKPIFDLRNPGLHPDDVAVVMGIHQNLENEVITLLKDNGFYCLIKPLWFVRG